MKPFDKALYEATLVAVGKILAKYNAFSQAIIMQDIGKEIISFLKKENYWFDEKGNLEDLDQLVNLFLENGFAEKLEVEPAAHGHNYTWHKLFLLTAYKELQDATGNPFISCPMNLCLSHLCAKHGKFFKLHDKTFDMDKGITVSNWELVNSEEAAGDDFDPLIIENARLVEIAEERANNLEKTRLKLEQTNRELLIAKQHAEEQTERLRAKTVELEKAREEADRAARIRSEFLSNMSHEIRTPMNGVIGIAALLEQTSLTSEQKELLNTINQSGDALLDIINSILDLSKIEAGRMQLKPRPFSPRELVENIKNTFLAQSTLKGINLSSHIDDEVPEKLLGDCSRIRQVLTNLLGNATKFTAHGSITLGLEVASSNDETTSLRFSVSDTGPGIEKSLQNTLFERFSQLNESKESHPGGTGLGLSISENLVKLMGGTIQLESVLGKGSTFSFTLPFSTCVSDSEDESTPCTHRLPAIDPGLSILLVDDNQTNLKVAQLILQHLGLKPHTASNGVEALKALGKNTFDIVFMDCQMPQMDGFECTQMLRSGDSINKDSIVIAMTAKALEGDQEKCIKAGMNDYLTKPVKPDTLAQTLAKWQEEARRSHESPRTEPSPS